MKSDVVIIGGGPAGASTAMNLLKEERPAVFALFVHHRHRNDMIDIFSGRIYKGQPSVGMQAMRKMLECDREESYQTGDSYSIPIGSRFHPERAAIWDIKGEVESTEARMGPR